MEEVQESCLMRQRRILGFWSQNHKAVKENVNQNLEQSIQLNGSVEKSGYNKTHRGKEWQVWYHKNFPAW